MRKYNIYFVLLLLVFVGGTIYGIIISQFNICPYNIIKTAYLRNHNNNRWSIGIYEGSTLFSLNANKDIPNPVLTANDVADRDAAFVADPFMVVKDGRYFVFFEVLNRKTNEGDIAYAESPDGKKWNYRKVVIDEKFHLSYPYIFEWDNNYYMIPESNEDFSVRLYKAIEFPEKWEYEGNLLSGHRFVDPSIFHYKNKWWMFVSNVENSILNLYYSENLTKGWRPHPKNPIVKFNKHFSRPGGRVILYDGKPLRLAQDDDPSYGIQVFAFEITDLSETSYTDKLVSNKPIVTKTGVGWNAAGMHHLDLHKIGDKWVSVADGRNK
jgi:hypothetical protein